MKAALPLAAVFLVLVAAPTAVWAGVRNGDHAAATVNNDQAVAAIKAKDFPAALALADKAVQAEANADTLFIHGFIEASLNNWTAAAADLEGAKAKAAAANADIGARVAIDEQLAMAWLMSGRLDQGVTLAKATMATDPTREQNLTNAILTAYDRAAMAQLQAGDREGAVKRKEEAAAAVPGRASQMLVEAGNILAGATPPDWARVEAEVRKALAANANDPQAYFAGAIARANQGDRDGAIKWLKEAKRGAGGDAQLNANIDGALKQLEGK